MDTDNNKQEIQAWGRRLSISEEDRGWSGVGILTFLALKMSDGLQSLHYGLKYISEIGSFCNEWREEAYVNACVHNG